MQGAINNGSALLTSLDEKRKAYMDCIDWTTIG